MKYNYVTIPGSFTSISNKSGSVSLQNEKYDWKKEY